MNGTIDLFEDNNKDNNLLDNKSKTFNKKYVIKLNKNKKDNEKTKNNKMEKMTKSFEDMMVQFQNMVQLNQLIQMNQINQMQIMNQLVELKSNVIETRQDLSYKLKELNGRIDEISNKRSNATTSRKNAISILEEDDNIDVSHLMPLCRENGISLFENRPINSNHIKSILKAKHISGFIKIFDILYKCKDLNHPDIYPIRVIKAKTLQYYNEEGVWIIDTNGTNIINILCNNIYILLYKINNDYLENGEFTENEFNDNQTFIEELDDKKVRNHILTSIKDLVINHSLNYKRKNNNIIQENNISKESV